MKRILGLIGFTCLSFFLFVKPSYAEEVPIPKTLSNGTQISFGTCCELRSGVPYEIESPIDIAVTEKSYQKDYYFLKSSKNNKKCLYGKILEYRNCKDKDQFLWKIEIADIFGSHYDKHYRADFFGGIHIRIQNKINDRCIKLPGAYFGGDLRLTRDDCRNALIPIYGGPTKDLCLTKPPKNKEEKLLCKCTEERQENCIDLILASRGEARELASTINKKQKIYPINYGGFFGKCKPKPGGSYFDGFENMICYDEFPKSMFSKDGMVTEKTMKISSARYVVKNLIRNKDKLGQHPEKAIRSIAYLEILYNLLLDDYTFDKKVKNDLRNAVLSFRNAFNFDQKIHVNDAISNYWVLAQIVEWGSTTKNEVPKELLDRKVALHSLKKSVAMLRSFIDFDTSINNKNQTATFNDELKLSSLNKEITTIVSSFEKYKKEISTPTSQLAKNIDIAMSEYKKTIRYVQTNLKNYKKKGKQEKLISTAYSLDLLYNLIGENLSKIPNQYEFQISQINKRYLGDHRLVIKKLVSNTNASKITEYKNTLFYTQQLQEGGFESLKIVKNLEELDFGLSNLEQTLNSVNLDANSLDFDDLDRAVDELNSVNLESVTASIEENFDESLQAVEQAVEEASSSIFESLTLGDAMEMIHEEVEGYTWFGPMELSEYIDKKGMTGIVDSTTTFSDAVDLYNSIEGTNLPDDVALIMVAAEVCQSAGMCTHPELKFPVVSNY